jgi:hypothetical protein
MNMHKPQAESSFVGKPIIVEDLRSKIFSNNDKFLFNAGFSV